MSLTDRLKYSITLNNPDPLLFYLHPHLLYQFIYCIRKPRHPPFTRDLLQSQQAKAAIHDLGVRYDQVFLFYLYLPEQQKVNICGAWRIFCLTQTSTVCLNGATPAQKLMGEPV